MTTWSLRGSSKSVSELYLCLMVAHWVTYFNFLYYSPPSLLEFTNGVNKIGSKTFCKSIKYAYKLYTKYVNLKL